MRGGAPKLGTPLAPPQPLPTGRPRVTSPDFARRAVRPCAPQPDANEYYKIIDQILVDNDGKNVRSPHISRVVCGLRCGPWAGARCATCYSHFFRVPRAHRWCVLRRWQSTSRRTPPRPSRRTSSATAQRRAAQSAAPCPHALTTHSPVSRAHPRFRSQPAALFAHRPLPFTSAPSVPHRLCTGSTRSDPRASSPCTWPRGTAPPGRNRSGTWSWTRCCSGGAGRLRRRRVTFRSGFCLAPERFWAVPSRGGCALSGGSGLPLNRARACVCRRCQYLIRTGSGVSMAAQASGRHTRASARPHAARARPPTPYSRSALA